LTFIMPQPQEQPGFINTDARSIPNLHRFAHEAMAAVFEIFIIHQNKTYAEQAAWAAFDEIDRLELLLSRYIPNSDIARISSLSPNTPLQISPETLECLQTAIRVSQQTNGAFDITIGSLFNAWLDENKTLRHPSQSQLESAKGRTGSNFLQLNGDDYTAQVLTEGVLLDLGAIGKGFAAQKAADLLGEWDITAALISAGKSTLLPLGCPPNSPGWPVTITNPQNPTQILARLNLKDTTLAASGLRKGAHIIDPRSAKAADANLAAWATNPDSAVADSLSTAFIIMSAAEIEQYCSSHSETLALVIQNTTPPHGDTPQIISFGPWQNLGQINF